jgi:hypothetical protein
VPINFNLGGNKPKKVIQITEERAWRPIPLSWTDGFGEVVI